MRYLIYTLIGAVPIPLLQGYLQLSEPITYHITKGFPISGYRKANQTWMTCIFFFCIDIYLISIAGSWANEEEKEAL